MPEEKSLGEKRVRTTFNPSDLTTVQDIKERAAHFINTVDSLAYTGCDPDLCREHGRLKALAMTKMEEAAMWAVKAATV